MKRVKSQHSATCATRHESTSEAQLQQTKSEAARTRVIKQEETKSFSYPQDPEFLYTYIMATKSSYVEEDFYHLFIKNKTEVRVLLKYY